MSYGWLTESALLPTRAVPIRGVSDSSLFSLSNQIFSLQQEQQQQQGLCPSGAVATTTGAAPIFRSVDKRKRKPIFRRASSSGGEEERCSGGQAWSSGGDGEDKEEGREGDTMRGEEKKKEEKKRRRKHLSALQEKAITSETEHAETEAERSSDYSVSHAATRRVWKRPSRKPKTREKLLFEEKNVGVEERAAKDEVEYKATQKTTGASRRRLEEKARLYEELDTRFHPTRAKKLRYALSGRLDCSSAPSGARLVVDFAEKLCRRSSVSAPSIKATLHPTEELKTKPLSAYEPEGDLLSNYYSPQYHERRQKERQKARRLRLDCLRSRLTSLREAAFLAARVQAAGARQHYNDFV